ncbi:MAG: tetratricopeptide repeat protein [Asgard group archaeon]|nr:tetratricopeptide repeat protein [Asgard group archaeon]
MVKKDEIRKLISEGLRNLQNNKSKQALELFNKALELDPKNSMLWNHKGVALRKLGEINEAITCYNKALKFDPESIRANLNKARALRSQKKYDLALFSYEDVLELDPDNLEAKEESKRVRDLLAKRAQLRANEKSIDKQKDEEEEIFEERRQDLMAFLEKSRKRIDGSIQKIKEMFEHGIKEEAIENREKIKSALISFDEQLYKRIKLISNEFVVIDFEEECRDLLDKWEVFKDRKLQELEKLS